MSAPSTMKAIKKTTKKQIRFSLVQFPGSNCDQDLAWVVEAKLNQPLKWVWHEEKKLPPTDVLLIPGGFSYGDYLRAGAIAATSPVMDAVRAYADKGGTVLGICNGFQILVESGLLPGALQENAGLKFVCQWVTVRVDEPKGPFLEHLPKGSLVKMTVAHAQGNYTPDPKGKPYSPALVYVDESGKTSEEANPNGSFGNIAGITNEAGNILGLMPHPERAADQLLGSVSGLQLFSPFA